MTLALPLKSEGKEVGILVAKSTNEPITEKDEDYLTQLSSQIATTINRANVYAISPVEHLIINDVNLGKKPVEDLPLTRYSGYPMGKLVARTGWEEGINSNTVVASMNFTQLYEANHQHLDSGHFDLYYCTLSDG